MKSIRTKPLNLEDSNQLAATLSKYLQNEDVIALSGDLGAGKTTLVANVTKHMGLANGEQVSSPTYVIHHIYHATFSIHHIDLYRIDSMSQIEDMGFDEFIGRNGITIVEWFEKFPKIWSGDTLKIQIDLVDLDRRTYFFEIQSIKTHERFEKLLREINEKFR